MFFSPSYAFLETALVVKLVFAHCLLTMLDVSILKLTFRQFSIPPSFANRGSKLILDRNVGREHETFTPFDALFLTPYTVFQG